jgi:hypothetical protein
VRGQGIVRNQAQCCQAQWVYAAKGLVKAGSTQPEIHMPVREEEASEGS